MRALLFVATLLMMAAATGCGTVEPEDLEPKQVEQAEEEPEEEMEWVCTRHKPWGACAWKELRPKVPTPTPAPQN